MNQHICRHIDHSNKQLCPTCYPHCTPQLNWHEKSTARRIRKVVEHRCPRDCIDYDYILEIYHFPEPLFRLR